MDADERKLRIKQRQQALDETRKQKLKREEQRKRNQALLKNGWLFVYIFMPKFLFP